MCAHTDTPRVSHKSNSLFGNSRKNLGEEMGGDQSLEAGLKRAALIVTYLYVRDIKLK